NEFGRILQLDTGGTECPSTCCQAPVNSPTKSPALSSWADAWHLYDNACLVCTSFWIGS
ncbi:hypothetical protein J3A83DRAFT_4097884, partial [Scleroderma citrinum]